MRKKYRLEITQAAKDDVAANHDFIARDKPKAAAKWVRTFDRHVRSLRYLPTRYEVIPEAEEIQFPYRHVIWGNYRIIYKIEDDLVTIVRVFHAARLLRTRHFEM